MKNEKCFLCNNEHEIAATPFPFVEDFCPYDPAGKAKIPRKVADGLHLLAELGKIEITSEHRHSSIIDCYSPEEEEHEPE